jgi:hypothetical protein
MTLILTHMSKYGIVQASDSNLSSQDAVAGTGDKVFQLAFGPGALAVAGSYGVGDEPMDVWMPEALLRYTTSSASPTLGGLAEDLRQRLEQEMTADQKKSSGSLIHIAGYTDEPEPHPEMYFVRNIKHIEPSGAYSGFEETFDVSEDFWTRDYPRYRSGMLYINGYPEGRIGYLGFGRALDAFLQQVWNQHPEWRFRAPRSLDDQAALLELKLRAIATMFLISDHPAPYVGGAPQSIKIAPPAGAIQIS